MADIYAGDDNALTLEDISDEREIVSALAKSAARKKERSHSTWHGTAFVLEVVVLLLFIAVSMAVVCMLFGKSFEVDQRADTLTRAMTLATTGAVNGAETFEADPTDPDCPMQVNYEFDGQTFRSADTYEPGMYVVRRDVEADESAAGTLYRAHICVSRYDETVCTLSVAKYQSKRTVTTASVGDKGAKGGE